MNKIKFSGIVVGAVLVIAILAVSAFIFSSASAGKGNECTGNSCEPLPTKAVACDGPAGEPGRNPHCNPEESPTVTAVPPTPTTPKPTATLVPPTPTEDSYLKVSTSSGVCEDGICPDPSCSLATIAAAQATMVSYKPTEIYLMNR